MRVPSLVLVLSLCSSGCYSSATRPEASSELTGSAAATTGTPVPTPLHAPPPAAATGSPGADAAPTLPSIFYAYQKADIDPQYLPGLKSEAGYLAAHPSTKIVIEGNCDERGSAEYNLALGERRATGVRQVLESDGASENQIEVLSNGKEKPRLSCHSESCWKENRRADIHPAA